MLDIPALKKIRKYHIMSYLFIPKLHPVYSYFLEFNRQHENIHNKVTANAVLLAFRFVLGQVSPGAGEIK